METMETMGAAPPTSRAIMRARSEAFALRETVKALRATLPAGEWGVVAGDLQHAVDAARDVERHLAAAYMERKGEELAAAKAATRCVACAREGRDTPAVVVGYAGAPLCEGHLTPRERVALLP
jgi:hypothetical protein